MQLHGLINLKIATIFSAPVNEDDPEADGLLSAEEPSAIEPAPENTPARARLDDYIANYNAVYRTSFDTRNQGGFYNYYRDISRRIKKHDKKGFDPKERVDILLVVNMFLTGFDAKKLNTIYVDKNLQYHGLIQAFSRTNRILNGQKSHGNVVAFRNLTDATDKALALYSNEDAKGTILLAPYQDYVATFNHETLEMLKIAPTVAAVSQLVDETAKMGFVQAFRAMIRTMNILRSFAEFQWSDLELPEQTYEDYKSKYLDLYDAVRQQQQADEPASILQDVDFELELIRRDEINVAYILKLLVNAPNSASDKDKQTRADIRKTIINMLDTEHELRSKRELIEKFIRDYWDNMQPSADIETAFQYFWDAERDSHLTTLCETEDLKIDVVEQLIEQYRFSGRTPVGDDVIGAMQSRPRILERRKRITSTTRKIMDMIEIFEDV